MRKINENVKRICRSKQLEEVYVNFEKMYDCDYLTEVLGIPVLNASSYQRNIALHVAKTDNTCMAAFPNIFGEGYLVIPEDKVDEAHKLGLEIRYI